MSNPVIGNGSIGINPGRIGAANEAGQGARDNASNSMQSQGPGSVLNMLSQIFKALKPPKI